MLIAVDGKPVIEHESLIRFWTDEVARRKGSGTTGICLVCGQDADLVDTVPGNISKRLVPGTENNAALVSVNERVFGYGLITGLANIPICLLHSGTLAEALWRRHCLHTDHPRHDDTSTTSKRTRAANNGVTALAGLTRGQSASERETPQWHRQEPVPARSARSQGRGACSSRPREDSRQPTVLLESARSACAARTARRRRACR